MDRHGLDAMSLLFGVLFAGVGLLLIAGAGVQLVTGSWIGPAAAILFGIVLLVAAPRPTRPSGTDSAGDAAESVDSA